MSSLLIGFAILVSQANAWHGPHGFNQGIHCGGYGYSYRNYGFGINHHSFYPPTYGSFFGGYASYGYWPSSYVYSGFQSCSPFYSFRINYRPTFYYPTYYAPTYYVPTYYVPTYSAPIYYNSCVSNGIVAPVNYGVVSTGINFTASARNLSYLASRSAPSNTSYVVRKPAAPLLPKYQQSSDSPFSNAISPTGYFVSTGLNGAKESTAPSDVLAAADAILAAGGYRQAAQAYAQLALNYGDSSDLYARRLVAQLADGNYEQAAVIINLVDANGLTLDRSNLPQGDLKLALGLGEKNESFIANRSEGLAANALQQPSDPIPLLTLSKWLSFSGDDQRAELFSRRAAQLRSNE